MTWSNVHCVLYVLCAEWITLEDIEMDVFFSNSLIILSSIDMTAWELFLPALFCLWCTLEQGLARGAPGQGGGGGAMLGGAACIQPGGTEGTVWSSTHDSV